MKLVCVDLKENNMSLSEVLEKSVNISHNMAVVKDNDKIVIIDITFTAIKNNTSIKKVEKFISKNFTFLIY